MNPKKARIATAVNIFLTRTFGLSTRTHNKNGGAVGNLAQITVIDSLFIEKYDGLSNAQPLIIVLPRTNATSLTEKKKITL